MVWSKSIVSAHVCLILGVTAFLCVPSGCSGSGSEDETKVSSDTHTPAPAPDSTVAQGTTSEPGSEVNEPAGEGGEQGDVKEPDKPAAEPEKPKPEPEKPKPEPEKPKADAPKPGGVVAAGKTAPCGGCHADKKDTAHVLKGASCVTCHLQTAAHLKKPTTKPELPSKRADCFKCHSSAAAAKSGAPKVADDHNGTEPCMTCHTIHDSGRP